MDQQRLLLQRNVQALLLDERFFAQNRHLYIALSLRLGEHFIQCGVFAHAIAAPSTSLSAWTMSSS